jgi:chaperonin GroES
MALNIKPLSDSVLIKPVAAETKLPSGFFIPDTAKKTTKGLLLLEMELKEHTMTVKIGDSVILW